MNPLCLHSVKLSHFGGSAVFSNIHAYYSLRNPRNAKTSIRNRISNIIIFVSVCSWVIASD